MLMVVLSNITGSVFIKLGAMAGSNRGFLGLISPLIVAGIGFFALSVILYTWALQRLPLHLAQAIGALQFLGVVLAAHFYFGEVIGPQKWVGMGLILLGLFFVLRN
jgi:drug/metabolite transporter (DMT)-like permease